MSQAANPYQTFGMPIAAQADADTRADFIRKTYVNLCGAVFAFVVIEAALLQLPNIAGIANSMTQGYNWLFVMGAFMFVSYIADRWAQSNVSIGQQYLGLGLYVVAEAVIFLPLMYFAASYRPAAITEAGLATLVIFSGLTATVFLTKKDFSFLRGILGIIGFAVIGLIVCSVLFGFELGTLFSVAMVAFASGYILFYTSNVLHHYRIGQHVAAALALFASVALLFWYILQIFMSRD